MSNPSSNFLGLPENASAHGPNVDHLIQVVHWFMGALFVGWSLFLIFVLIRFWHRNNAKASYEGVRNHISSHIEIGVVLIEAVLLLGFAFPLWGDRVDSWETVQKQNPIRVRVVGFQFGWLLHYPGKDGKFGRVDPTLISDDNPLGLDPNDPDSADDFLSKNLLKLPEKHPVVLNVTSKDVIHNYSLIPMRIQQDAIPGKEIPMWFTPVKPLETFVVCGQLCGEKHGDMVGRMEIISQKAFDDWAASQSDDALKANQAKTAAKPKAEH